MSEDIVATIQVEQPIVVTLASNNSEEIQTTIKLEQDIVIEILVG
jgi:hypothetical protein